MTVENGIARQLSCVKFVSVVGKNCAALCFSAFKAVCKVIIVISGLHYRVVDNLAVVFSYGNPAYYVIVLVVKLHKACKDFGFFLSDSFLFLIAEVKLSFNSIFVLVAQIIVIICELNISARFDSSVDNVNQKRAACNNKRYNRDIKNNFTHRFGDGVALTGENCISQFHEDILLFSGRLIFLF